MWTIDGQFDGDDQKDLPPVAKSKLLKTGSQYALGRRDTPLIVNSHKISKHHGTFIVGGYTADDVANPDTIPTLEYLSLKGKAPYLKRDGQTTYLPPNSVQTLQDGDIISPISGCELKLTWQRICCYEPSMKGRSAVSIDGCASLGINFVRTPNPSITHHLTPSITLTPAVATSLLVAAHFVKPNWLTDLLTSATLPSTDTKSPEYKLNLPSESKYQPAFTSSVLSEIKNFEKYWRPNEERMNFLSKYKFIFVGEAGREASSEYQTLVERGRGELEVFDVAAGVEKWGKAIEKGKKWATKQHGRLVLVADSEVMEAAAGKKVWKAFVHEAMSSDLEFVLPENILQAIAHVDKSWMESSVINDLPRIVQNTHHDEPTYPPDGSLEAGPSSNQASAPVPDEEQPISELESAPAPAAPEEASARRPFRRIRSKQPKSLLSMLGLEDDDDSIMDTSVSETTTPAPEPPKPVTQARAPSRFTPRSRRSPAPPNSALDLLGLGGDDDDVLPTASKSASLSKYKDLFDATDPDKLKSQWEQEELERQSMTQSQGGVNGMSGGVRSAKRVALGIVAEEEEEESQAVGGGPGVGSLARGTKRKSAQMDVEMDKAERREMEDDPDAEMEDGPQNPYKRRALENINGVEPIASQTQAHQSGASQAVPLASQTGKKGHLPTTSSQSLRFAKPPSQQETDSKKKKKKDGPDTDDNFLRAVNSVKKGKKQEDVFDKEFNELRISKPDVKEMDKQRSQREEEWKLMSREDFGDETLRGNFMVVVELDISVESARARSAARGVGRVVAGPLEQGSEKWVGRPNFKKFKKQPVAHASRPMIDLFPSEESTNDYGMGTSYWKSSKASQSMDVSSQDPRATQKSSKGQRSQPIDGLQSRAATQAPEHAEVDFNSEEEVEEDVAPSRKRARPAAVAVRAPVSKAKKPPSVASSAGGRTTRSTRAASQALFLASEDDEESQPKSRSHAKTRATASGSKKRGHQSIQKDEEYEEFDLGSVAIDREDEAAPEDSDEETLRTQGSTRSTRNTATTGSKRTRKVIQDDDSDDAVFKGFKGRKKKKF